MATRASRQKDAAKAKEQPFHAADLANGDSRFSIESLDELQNESYRNHLGIIDRLRSKGAGGLLQLPQIVVCGDQSSGKSSVLEALTEVPFPSKEGMCTRFATEIIMRRSEEESITTKIIPDRQRTEAQKKQLLAFADQITDLKDFPALVARATKKMGLSIGKSGQKGPVAFTKDRLSVEISGPDRPELTLVDIPGLIQSATSEQSEQDVKLIHDMVDGYLQEERTIMLAVVSATHDYANQGIIEKCRRVDREGNRTLGIVTKPDRVEDGSDNHAKFIRLVQNKDIKFNLGWHILVNKSEDHPDGYFAGRNVVEQRFLNKGQYCAIPKAHKGIAALRTRLADRLFQHLKNELPGLKIEVKNNLQEVNSELLELGDGRTTPPAQRRFLILKSTAYHRIVEDATAGHFNHPFFREIDATKPVDDPTNVRRFRACVQARNQQFTSQMRQYGHRFRVWETEDSAGTDEKRNKPEAALSKIYDEAKELQSTKTRAQAVEWARDILVRSRGLELPGNHNPEIVAQLFREQSVHWEDLAQAHLDQVHKLCCKFVRRAARYVMDETIFEKLHEVRLEQVLETRYENACEELARLVEDKDRPPMVFDDTYSENLRKRQALKRSSNMLAARQRIMTGVRTGQMYQNDITEKLVDDLLEETLIAGADSLNAEGVFDSMVAYYDIKVRQFYANVTEQVIERHLISDLAAQTLSPEIVEEMEDDEVKAIATEDQTITARRAELLENKKVLQSAHDELWPLSGSVKRNMAGVERTAGVPKKVRV